ncbi:MAG: hypothetical protein IKG25_05375 [Mogibacterium sp.]|nr:hypothetical protein [Mogibacterium sp.]
MAATKEKTEGHVIGFDDEIEQDGGSFVLLTPGAYEFKVIDRKIDKFHGSEKIPKDTPKVVLMLEIHSPEGTATVKADLIMWSTLEWKLSEFFRSIGQKKHGEKLKPNWKTVMGATGKVMIKNRTYIGQDGKERKANDVEQFLDPDYKIVPIEKPKVDNFIGVPEDGVDDMPW